MMAGKRVSLSDLGRASAKVDILFNIGWGRAGPAPDISCCERRRTQRLYNTPRGKRAA